MHNTCCIYHHVCMCVRKETFPGRRKSIQAGHKHGHSSRSSLQSSSYRRHTVLIYDLYLILVTTIQTAVVFLFRACVPNIDDDDFIRRSHAFCLLRVLCQLWYYFCLLLQFTRSYAALRAADLEWIVGPGYSLSGSQLTFLSNHKNFGQGGGAGQE